MIGVGAGIALATTSAKTDESHTGSSDRIVTHIHPKLSLYVDGRFTEIPANIGIDPSLYKNHTLDTYGMKMPDMPSMPVMYPTHTHDTSGTIHVESTVTRDYTVGDFLNVWGMDFSGRIVKMTVDGEPVYDTEITVGDKTFRSDYRNHVFKDGERIKLEVG